jgi:hypothetical protein
MTCRRRRRCRLWSADILSGLISGDNLAHPREQVPVARRVGCFSPAWDQSRGVRRVHLKSSSDTVLIAVTLHDAGHTYSPEYVASSFDLVEEYKRAYRLLAAADRLSLQLTTAQHGYGCELRRSTCAWFNRWFEMKNAGDEEPSQAVETEETLFVTPTGFVTTSFGGETALSLTRRMAAAIRTPPAGPVDDTRTRIRAVFGIERPRGEPLASRVLATIRKPGYRAEQVEFTSDREIRVPGWLLTPDGARSSTPAVLTSANRRRGARPPRTDLPSGCVARADAERQRSTFADAAIAPSRTRSAAGFAFQIASHSGLPHARVQTTGDQDTVPIVAAWIRGRDSP